MFEAQKVWQDSIVIAVVLLYEGPVSALPETSSAQPRYFQDPMLCPGVRVPINVDGEEVLDTADVVDIVGVEVFELVDTAY